MKRKNIENASHQRNFNTNLEKIIIQTKSLSVWLKIISIIMFFYLIAIHVNENRYSDIEYITITSILASLFISIFILGEDARKMNSKKTFEAFLVYHSHLILTIKIVCVLLLVILISWFVGCVITHS